MYQLGYSHDAVCFCIRLAAVCFACLLGYLIFKLNIALALYLGFILALVMNFLCVITYIYVTLI